LGGLVEKDNRRTIPATGTKKGGFGRRWTKTLRTSQKVKGSKKKNRPLSEKKWPRIF